jgi:hypothetical protein
VNPSGSGRRLYWVNSSAAISPLVLAGLVAGAVAVMGPSPAQARALLLETGTPRVRVTISLPRPGRLRPSVRIEPRARPASRPARPPSASRPARPPSASRPARLPPVARGIPAGADHDCLAALHDLRVPFVPAGAVRGIATPVEVTGAIGGVQLISRGRRAPVMDCELARALAGAAPSMRQLGVSGLSFSATYDYRVVKGTSRLSGHARGLAIDVHALVTTLGTLDVERDYARDPGRWQATGRDPVACVGAPATPQGRLLRALACELRGQPAIGLLLGPDDNHDHRNHLHIEARPGGVARELLSGRDQAPRRQGRRASRR